MKICLPFRIYIIMVKFWIQIWFDGKSLWASVNSCNSSSASSKYRVATILMSKWWQPYLSAAYYFESGDLILEIAKMIMWQTMYIIIFYLSNFKLKCTMNNFWRNGKRSKIFKGIPTNILIRGNVGGVVFCNSLYTCFIIYYGMLLIRVEFTRAPTLLVIINYY